MRDFTLLIPTYNRPRQLQALLFHIKTTAPGIRVLVLDSSDRQPEIHHCASDAEIVWYASDTHPFAKFADGVQRVTTEYCGLCADDDVMLMDGVEACLAVLRLDFTAAAARGQAFSYQWSEVDPDGLYMTDGLSTPPQINGGTPMERLAALFAPYHAVIYSVHRTTILRQAMDTATGMLGSMLGLELMVAALVAASGGVLTVPVPVHGRCMGESVIPYRDWHPLEYFCNNTDGMAAEYATYRTLLTAAVLANPANKLQDNQVKRAIDIIHLRYLLQHAPDAVLDFLIGRRSTGIQPEGYLAPEMQDILLRASMTSVRTMDKGERDAIAGKLGNYMHALLDPHALTAKVSIAPVTPRAEQVSHPGQ